MIGACSHAERAELSRRMECFCDQMAGATEHAAAELEAGWTIIFERRRMTEPNDRRTIYCQDRLARMWTDWQRAWFPANLTPKQNQKKWREKKWREKTSIWNAFIKRNAGTERLVMAFWQTGVPWAPPLEMLNSNLTGALEHVATHFARWTRQLARSVAYHKRLPATEEATRRSGRSRGQHGLTDQEWQDREDKRRATRDYYWAIELHAEDQAAKTKAGRGIIKREALQSTLTVQSISKKCGAASNGLFTITGLAPSSSYVFRSRSRCCMQILHRD